MNWKKRDIAAVIIGIFILCSILGNYFLVGRDQSLERNILLANDHIAKHCLSIEAIKKDFHQLPPANHLDNPHTDNGVAFGSTHNGKPVIRYTSQHSIAGYFPFGTNRLLKNDLFDPFNYQDGEYMPMTYVRSMHTSHTYLLLSYGPDEDLDVLIPFDLKANTEMLFTEDAEVKKPDINTLYDPTNGLRSSGDIWVYYDNR